MLTAPRRVYGWRTGGDAAREALLGVLIGVLWTFIDGPEKYLARHHVLVALAVILAARGLETMMSWAIEQSHFPTFFRGIIYLLGGGIGCFVAGDFPLDLLDAGAVLLLLALMIGLVLHHNRKRSDRMAASIARLKEHEFAEKELELARDMQQRLLAPPLVERDGLRVTARTHAAHIVGGDFYDVLRLSDRITAVVAADVSGKGMAASLIMASCKAMIPFVAANGTAAEAMHALNERLCEQLQRREFVAMVLVRLDVVTGEAEIVNAGMPDPLLVRPDGVDVVACSGDRLPLGAMRTARYEATSVTLRPGERLFLFSDGLPEATSDGMPIGYDRVEDIAARAESIDDVIAQVRAIPGIHIDDDVTVVSLERSATTVASASTARAMRA